VISRLKTILCVDDHWNGLISRKMLLESNGYNVLEATGGEEGLRLLLSHPVDAVVLDYQMPGMNGDVVAAKMKRAKSHIPIMLLSSFGPLPKSKLEAVDIFLSKSEPPKVLLSKLQHLLNRRPKPLSVSDSLVPLELLLGLRRPRTLFSNCACLNFAFQFVSPL
jgi:CheY-like chemotaxis protein